MNIDDHNSAADSFVINPKDAHATGEKLPLTTIDKLVAELNLPRVDFIKMDIEGAEVKALHGGRKTSRNIIHAWRSPSITSRIIRWKYQKLQKRRGRATPLSVALAQ